MGIRTVRLDEDGEQILEELVQQTGLSISAVFKRGLQMMRDQVAQRPTAYEIYQDLDLGEGGYSPVPSTETRRGAQEAIRRKHAR